MKKLLAIMLSIMLLLTGCGNSSSPKNTIKEFLEAAKQFDIEKMSEYVRNEERDEETEQKLLQLKKMEKIFKTFSSQLTYEIDESIIEEETANITVVLHYPDASSLYKTALGNYITNAMTKAFSGENPSTEEMEEMLYQNIKEQMDQAKEQKQEFSNKKQEVQIHCMKENGKWVLEDTDNIVLNAMTGNYLDTLTNLE